MYQWEIHLDTDHPEASVAAILERALLEAVAEIAATGARVEGNVFSPDGHAVCGYVGNPPLERT